MKSGFISIIGKPNVGKSTLLNQIMGEKFAITSKKPQTTRNRIQCVYNYDGGQMIFIDTPGIHKPKHKLDEYMMKAAYSTVGDVDIILLLVEPGKPAEADLNILRTLDPHGNIFLVVNKIDSVKDDTLLKTVPAYAEAFDFKEIVPISAYEGTNVDTLLELIDRYLPEGEQLFPEDMITDQPERQLAAEFIREKALYVLDQEIPHGIAVVIEQFEERTNRAGEDILDISAAIICERDSHKPIIIGKGGRTIREIGMQARHELEHFFRIKVNLQLFVKVKNGWRDSDIQVRNMGYDVRTLDR